MFPGRYFPWRFFAERYWPKVGGVSTAQGQLNAGPAKIVGSATAGTAPAEAPVVQTTTIGVNAGATTVTTAKPTGTASGELLIFAHGADGGSGTRILTGPTGAITVAESEPAGAAVVSEVSRLTTGPSEPTTYTATISQIERQILIALRVTGTNPEDAIDGVAVNTGSGAQPVCPDLVTTEPNCRIIRVMSKDFTIGTLIEDTGYPPGTEGYYLRGETVIGGGGNTLLGAASSVQSSPGAVGTATWTPNVANTTPWAAYTLAIKPGLSLGPTADGLLISGATEINGQATIAQLAQGALVAGLSSIAGQAQTHRLSEGALTAGLTTIAGMAAIPVPLEASGTLTSGAAVIEGVAITHRLAAGDLISGAAIIDGSAALNVVAQGALVSGSAQISGMAFIPAYATGALVAGSAIINGIAVYGDGWSPANPGGAEVWSPVSSGGFEDWQEVPKGGEETWQ